jgi:hypothetical protein
MHFSEIADATVRAFSDQAGSYPAGGEVVGAFAWAAYGAERGTPRLAFPAMIRQVASSYALRSSDSHAAVIVCTGYRAGKPPIRPACAL